MLSQSHSVNTSIESCTAHLLRQEEPQLQSEKNAQCERALNVFDQRYGFVLFHQFMQFSKF